MTTTQTTTEKTTQSQTHRMGLIIGSSLLALTLACGGGYIGLNQLRGQHVAQCERSNTAYSTAVTALNSERDSLKKLADSTTQDAVDDKTVLTTAQKLVKETQPDTNLESCDTIGLFDFTTSKFTDREKTAEEFAKRGEELKKAGAAIAASVELKKLNDVKAAANALIEQANSLLASSDGKVADENTRTTLKNNIDNLTSVMAKNGVIVDEITSAMQSVTDATTAVNTSMDAKTQADQAAAQAQRRNTRNNRSANRGGSTYRGNTPQRTTNAVPDTYDWRAERERIHASQPPIECDAVCKAHVFGY